MLSEIILAASEDEDKFLASLNLFLNSPIIIVIGVFCGIVSAVAVVAYKIYKKTLPMVEQTFETTIGNDTSIRTTTKTNDPDAIIPDPGTAEQIISHWNTLFTRQSEIVEDFGERIDSLEKRLDERNVLVDTLQKDLENKERELADKQKRIEQLEQQLDLYRKQRERDIDRIKELEATISSLRDKVIALEDEIRTSKDLKEK